MHITNRLWNEEAGFVASTDLLLVSVILTLGMVVGLVSVRDQVVQELGDLSVAVGQLNQSYSFSGFAITLMSGATVLGTFSVSGSNYTDEADFCDAPGAPTACIVFVPADEE
jgi:hypothetical protein